MDGVRGAIRREISMSDIIWHLIRTLMLQVLILSCIIFKAVDWKGGCRDDLLIFGVARLSLQIQFMTAKKIGWVRPT
ncbi:hypothetical protein HMPREF3115_25820 [Burkholderia sp. HMSC10F09]|nr:hypothetical protein HMPREF3115_25820 [Burkholderia sp. HMSC10F09]